MCVPGLYRAHKCSRVILRDHHLTGIRAHLHVQPQFVRAVLSKRQPKHARSVRSEDCSEPLDFCLHENSWRPYLLGSVVSCAKISLLTWPLSVFLNPRIPRTNSCCYWAISHICCCCFLCWREDLEECCRSQELTFCGCSLHCVILALGRKDSPICRTNSSCTQPIQAVSSWNWLMTWAVFTWDTSHIVFISVHSLDLLHTRNCDGNKLTM